MKVQHALAIISAYENQGYKTRSQQELLKEARAVVWTVAENIRLGRANDDLSAD